MIQKMIQPFRHLQTTSAFKEFDLLDQNICDNLSITFLYFFPALPLSYCIYCFGCKFIKTKFNYSSKYSKVFCYVVFYLSLAYGKKKKKILNEKKENCE